MIAETLLVALLLVLASTGVHYEMLRFGSRLVIHGVARPRINLFIVVGTAFLSHLVHCALFASAYLFIERYSNLGAIEGLNEARGFDDFFYFSISTYTTLGFGDLVPTGALRLLAGIEALFGLVIIAWSASFTYLAMERFWGLGQKADD